ncbi:MAG: hypothetical protein HeimC2_10620 [Candidatus Heimdallarchaeota archaeon LC_2]|nr:MAG: hypothetical protein HeimC2_10620 [Candidatus Heimdallarchaeota archaeon LC_2]
MVLNSFLAYGLVQLILVALMKLNEIPKESKVGVITLKSNLSDTGVIIEVFPDFYFGQGHSAIVLLWNIACVSVFAYSYLRMKNPFNYLHFSKIRKLWLLFSLSYLLLQIFVLISLFGNDAFLGFGSLFQLLGIIGIVYVAIFRPEGLLLNHVQILKAVSLFESLERDDKTMKFPLTKVFDYIEYMSQHVQSSIDEDSH